MTSPSSGISEDDLRGRSNLARRGEITYSSLRLRIPSQERSLHISPDRITRHASPSRRSVVADEQEVVPRIPQPYRTSFSAVTSPRRVPRPSNLAPLSRTNPYRSTMPGRITSPDQRSDYMSPEQRTEFTFQSYDHRHGVSKHSLDSSNVLSSAAKSHRKNSGNLTSRSAENVLNGSTEMQVSKPGFSTPDLNINKTLVNGDDTVRAFMAASNGTIQTQNTQDSDVVSSTVESTDFTDGGTSPEVFTFEVEAKKLITREYVHVNDISYFKALDKKSKLPVPNEETERIVDTMMRGKKRDWWLRHRDNTGMSLPTSPDDAPKLRPQRSGTLPSETLLAGKPMASTPVKRSLSTSITNFFKRMSPKSLRRSPKGSQKSGGKTNATPDSSTNSLQAVFCDSADDLSMDSDPSGSQSKKIKSPKGSPIRNLLTQSFRKSRERLSSKSPVSSSSSKEANLGKVSKSPSPIPPAALENRSPCGSSQALPNDSARILKSIENNAHVVSEKTVYHAFKEKQSPKHMAEAMSMKPQALKAVEFSDECLNHKDSVTKSDTAIDDVDNAQSIPLIDVIHRPLNNEDLPKVASLPGTLDKEGRKKEPTGMLLLPKHDLNTLGGVRRANDPPKTLDVREVAKLQKAVFQFPSMSAESIGTCSVNLYTSGSEPSLLSRNGQRSSSVTASKRTLVSQDTDPSPQKGDSGEHRASSQPTLLDTGMPVTTATGIMTSDGNYDAIDPATTTPKTPSYMKISCALSGYNRYNSYTSPKQEAKLKVLKLGGNEQNGSHSSLSSQQSDSTSSSMPASSATGDDVRTSSDLNLKVVTDDPSGTKTKTIITKEPVSNGITKSSINNTRLLNGTVNTGDSTSSTTVVNGATTHRPVAMVTNGRTDGAVVIEDLEDEFDDVDRSVIKANSALHPAGNDVLTSQELKLPLEDKRKAELRSAVSTPSPSKDGYYYFPVLDKEVARIRLMCSQCEDDLANNSLPEEVSGKMRAAIGKSNLLINKKFQQFRGLCEANINQDREEAFQTKVADLAGFWDMVSLQISDIDVNFADIEKMRQSGWKVVKDSPVKQPGTTAKGGTPKKSPRDKSASSTSSSMASKSSKASEAARARDEARKRLLAAKRAGRQRKASQSDKDEIEIFVAE